MGFRGYDDWKLRSPYENEEEIPLCEDCGEQDCVCELLKQFTNGNFIGCLDDRLDEFPEMLDEDIPF
jgi:hypothetical protein